MLRVVSLRVLSGAGVWALGCKWGLAAGVLGRDEAGIGTVWAARPEAGEARGCSGRPRDAVSWRGDPAVPRRGDLFRLAPVGSVVAWKDLAWPRPWREGDRNPNHALEATLSRSIFLCV